MAVRRLVSAVLAVAALQLAATPAWAIDKFLVQGLLHVCMEAVRNDASEPVKGTAPDCPASKPTGMYITMQPGGSNFLGIPGLRFNFADKRKWMNRFGNWEFQTGGSGTCTKVNVLAPEEAAVPCAMAVSGRIGPEGLSGVGAACGASRGYDGMGTVWAANGTDYDVSDVGWILSAGGSYVLTGNFDRRTGDPKEELPEIEKSDSGSFAGAFQAQGGGACLKNPIFGESGATTFNVVGSVVMALPG